MRPSGPNVAKLEQVAAALGPLCERLIFVGGCAVDLLLSDPAASAPRLTFDVDLVVSVQTLRDYHATEAELARRGFRRDLSPDAPICRWRFNDIEVALMPTDASILGFANRWYPLAAETAQAVALPSGQAVRLIRAPEFIATKLEAFRDRGRSDYLASHDLEDIINVIDGRAELPAESAAAAPALRQYLGEQFRALRDNTEFRNAVPGLIMPGESIGSRLPVLMRRIEAIAALV